MPPDQALATKGTARAREGNAVTNTCPQCCGACPAWRPLVQCPNASACFDGPPPPPRTVYICRTVRCSNGEDLLPGTVVFLDGLCWTVGAGTVQNPPLAQRVTGLASVQCVTTCHDPLCPQEELYYPTEPCVVGVPPIWVCGVTGCEVRGCHTIRPLNGRPLNEVPPGSIIMRAIDLGPVRRGCCDPPFPGSDPCGNCFDAPIFEGFGVPLPGEPCSIGVPREQRCCCHRDEAGQLATRLRIRQWSTFQRVTNTGPGSGPHNNGTIRITLNAPIPMPNGCESYTVHVQRRGFNQPDEDFEGRPPLLSTVCEACGNWPFRAPRLFGTLEHGQQITGTELHEWGYDCTHTPNSPATADAPGWVTSWTCQRMSQRASYTYRFPPGTVIETTFEFVAEIVLPGFPDERDPCGAPCGGRINNGQPVGDVQDAPGGSGFPAGDVRGFL